MTSSALDIAVVAHDIVRHDGQGRAVLELLRALAGRGHHVTAFAHRLDAELAGAVAFERISRLPGPQLADDGWLFAAATRAVRRRRHDVNVVLGPCALPRAPFVYYAQFSQRGWARSWDGATRPSAYHRLHTWVGDVVERRVAARASAVVACSASVGADLAPGGDRLTVVPNGVDLDEVTPAPPDRRAEARRQLGLDESATVVAFVGEYRTSRKGLEPLIAAVAAGTEVLAVAGDGDQARARTQATSTGLGDRLHLLGVTPSATVFAAADVVAVPSRYEPFSLVAVEGAAAGLPVVLSAVAGAAAHLPTAAVVVERPDDVAELRAAINQAVARATDPGACSGRRADAVALAWPRCAAGVAEVVEAAAR